MTSDTSQLGLAVGQTSETRQKPGLKHIVQQKHLREKCTHPNKRPKFRGAGFHGLDYELRAERAKTGCHCIFKPPESIFNTLPKQAKNL